MALASNVYDALEAIVGEKNITQDEGVFLSYMYAPFGLFPETGKFTPVPPEAVLLPGSTEEVQEIVRTCNQHQLMYKAHSTGWGPWGLAGMPNVVLLDMRRMNRILEIDEKNMYAVVEPYVIAGQLQAEAMKKGLDCHIVSAGPTHSPLAGATSWNGSGPKGYTTSIHDRNVLGVEWVLPTGEVLKLGSPGSDMGWFSGDGPGPSLRGIMRGYYGACGGLGVFTKVALKLYPWGGPKELPIKGKNPQYYMELPENCSYHRPYWDNWKDYLRAAYKIGEANVAYGITRQPTSATNTYLTSSNNELYARKVDGSLPVRKEQRLCFDITIVGHTRREFEYKEKAFKRIISDTNASLTEFTPEEAGLLFMTHLKLSYLPRVCRASGELCSSFGLEESPGLIEKVTKVGEDLMTPYHQTGQFVNEGGNESFWGWSTDQGRHMHWENAYSFDPTDPQSRGANLEHVMKTATIINQDGGMGVVMIPGMMGPFADMFGPVAGDNIQHWMRQIKNTFDPKCSSDPSYYVFPEPAELPPSPTSDEEV